MGTHTDRYEKAKAKLQRHGQDHLLAFWDQLDDGQRTQLLDDIDQVDFPRCEPLIGPFVRNRPSFTPPTRLEPAPTLPAAPTPDLHDRYRRARKVGADAIRAGKVAAFTVAGGQGTRLGFDGPKGAFRISPVRRAPLFQIFAEYLLGVERRYGKRPSWYIMTSPLNHVDTVTFFKEHAHFGLNPDGVRFFQQAQMPAFLPDGRIALAEKHRVALSPDGHGGSLSALAASGSLAEMRARGVEHISYFQVDNPLVHVVDPLFIGLHIGAQSEMSSKAVAKVDDLERVGNFCLADGKTAVIEYSDLSDGLAHQKNADGSRRFDAGSIAIHVIDRGFVERLTAQGAATRMPWHRADKKVQIVDERGVTVTPDQPNVVKLEMFVFDAIPLARNPLVLFTPREEEFSPVKNAEGTDSAVTALRDLQRRAARWLEECGCAIPRDKTGEPEVTIEISPKFALDCDDLHERLAGPPGIKPGEPLLLT